jgi:hypothetical protein
MAACQHFFRACRQLPTRIPDSHSVVPTRLRPAEKLLSGAGKIPGRVSAKSAARVGRQHFGEPILLINCAPGAEHRFSGFDGGAIGIPPFPVWRETATGVRTLLPVGRKVATANREGVDDLSGVQLSRRYSAARACAGRPSPYASVAAMRPSVFAPAWETRIRLVRFWKS